MRGKVWDDRREIVSFGITPAYAGKRSPRNVPMPQDGDHPRLCGEKFGDCGNSPPAIGSPPPMRGKDATEHIVNSGNGITPAYAGKSVGNYIAVCRNRDHPRLCGEKVRLYHAEQSALGSPPPMRGKVYGTLHAQCGRRITPAYAGKS